MMSSTLRTKEDLNGIGHMERKKRGLPIRGLRSQWGRQHKTLCYAMDVNAQISAWWIRQEKNPRDKFANKTRKKKRLILKVARNGA